MLDNEACPGDQSILLALRDAVKVERDGLIRHQMKQTADHVQDVVDSFSAKPTPDLMRELNGAWVRAIHYLSIAKGGNDAGPNPTGVAEGARLAA